MLAALIGCLLVYVPGFAAPAKGAHRWIEIDPIRFQPSEFAKLALVIYMAKMLTDRRAVEQDKQVLEHLEKALKKLQ